MHGNQEIPASPRSPEKNGGPEGRTDKGNPLMHGAGKSDCRVVPVKVSNRHPYRNTGSAIGFELHTSHKTPSNAPKRHLPLPLR